jgi:glyoxylate/hydroxypyruvate reductase A
MAILIKPSVDPASRWIEVFAQQAPAETLRVWPDMGDPKDIEFAIMRRPDPGSLEPCSNLRWVASIPAGVEPMLDTGVVPTRVPIIRCVSPNRGEEMAQYVLLQVLRFHRRIPEYEAMMATGGWDRLAQPSTDECRVGVMGLGELGEQVARRLSAAGFDTAGWTRTTREVPGVVNFCGTSALKAFMQRCDIVVCVLPLTPDTQGIVNATSLGWMPRASAVINVSRGGHVNEPDLIEAIDSGQLRGACLDVLSVEPPTPELAVAHHPKIYVTPHIACRSRAHQLLPALLDNMARARAGRPLCNVVERERGY